MVDRQDKSPLTRRQFLKGAAAVAAGAALGGPGLARAASGGTPNAVSADKTASGETPDGVPAGAKGRRGPSERITLACIGLGGMGTGNLRAFLDQHDTQVVAVCDVDRAHREAARRIVEEHYGNSQKQPYQGCAAVNDFRELLARPDIDAVMIATPDHWHAPIAIAAARAGKDVYCEKPISKTVAEGRAICESMQSNGRVFQTGTWQRSREGFRFASELVRNGRLGRLHTIEIGLPDKRIVIPRQPVMPVPEGFDYEMWLGPAPWVPYTEKRCHYNFRFFSDYAGGTVTDWGAHHCDIAQWALGMDGSGPGEFAGAGDFPRDAASDMPVDYHFTCVYPGGARATISNKFENGLKFIGDTGWLFISRERMAASPKLLLGETITPGEIHLERSGDHYRNFLDCVRSRGVTITPAETAHRAATVCHLGNLAMRLGRTLKWDPAREMIVNDPEAHRLLARAMRSPWQL